MNSPGSTWGHETANILLWGELVRSLRGLVGKLERVQAHTEDAAGVRCLYVGNSRPTG